MVTESPYNPCGGHPALDFVNSIDRSIRGTGEERLVDYAALLAWSEGAGTLSGARIRVLSAEARARPEEARAALEQAIELREALYPVFQAAIDGEPAPPEALARVNADLARALAHASITECPAPAGGTAAFTWGWEDSTDLTAPSWPVVRGAAELLVSPDLERIKHCASDCRWLFVDRSRNHGRRWCEMSVCGNRAKVRKHRRRQRTSG